jgi:DNA polymerase
MGRYVDDCIELVRSGCDLDTFKGAMAQWQADQNLNAEERHENPIQFRGLDMISVCLRPCLIAGSLTAATPTDTDGATSGSSFVGLQSVGTASVEAIAPVGSVRPLKKTNDLIIADYNAIEARGTAWLAGAKNLLGVFARQEDPYLYQACHIYHVPQGTFTKKDLMQRQLGKKTVLACGYQMGWENFQTQCRMETPPIILSDPEAKEVVKAYREGNPEIPDLWKELERGALQAVLHPETRVECAGGKIVWYRKGTWLYMRLPSGRLLSYADPHVALRDMPWLNDYGEQAKKRCVGFMGINSKTHRWSRQWGYGGLWTENAVQAICRDLLMAALLRLEAAGYPIVLSVHDEAVAEVPVDFGSVAEFEEIMCVAPDWAEGFPIKAEGWRGARYKK